MTSMPIWIDLLVYAALIAACWFILPTWSSRFGVQKLADRNPVWVDANPEAAERIGGGGWLVWSCYLWGVLSLAGLLSLALGEWPLSLRSSALGGETWDRLKNLSSILLIVGLIYYFGCQALLERRRRRIVPLAERRQATLDRRSIDDFIPRWLRVAAYAMAGMQAAAWLAAALWHDISGERLWAGLISLLIFSSISFIVTRLSVGRRHNALDRMFGPGYRQAEVRTAFSCEVLIIVMFALRLSSEIVDPLTLNVDRVLHLGLVMLITAGVLHLTRHPTSPARSGDLRPS
jgi:hypothetical protein